MEYILQIMKDMNMGSYRDVKELNFCSEVWRAAANPDWLGIQTYVCEN